MGQAKNKAKTFEERKALAIARDTAIAAARQKVLDDALNVKLIAEIKILAEREGTTPISDEEITSMPYEKRQRIYCQAFEANRKANELKKVDDDTVPRHSAFGPRRANYRNTSLMAAAVIAMSLGSGLSR